MAEKVKVEKIGRKWRAAFVVPSVRPNAPLVEISLWANTEKEAWERYNEFNNTFIDTANA